MSKVYMFPGQGAQFRGMGKQLFDQFPQLVSEADQVLGYSIKDLCLNDPQRVLNRTDYTQPALYVVNAMHYMQQANASSVPQFIIGHSLGEFNALLAAGAYDFATGLRIVKKRGELMAAAKQGTMTAVMHLSPVAIAEILQDNGIDSLDLANINSEQQVIVSGLTEDIERCEPILEAAGARCVRMNVSAAFHSRYMADSQAQFEQFLATIQFNELHTDVVSNWTGELYPRTDYQANIANQLSNPVQWYASVSRLLASGCSDFVELGPNDVLSKLVSRIREKPMQIDGFALPVRKNVFMYSGQGSQYYQMGRELYENNHAFRNSMDKCNSIIEDLGGLSLIDTLYGENDKTQAFSNIKATHPSLFCFGYCLTQALNDAGLETHAVVGYSLGEYVAAVVSGALSLEQALTIIVKQADVLAENATDGGMLTVIKSLDHFHANPQVYKGTELAGINYQENFVISGDREDLLGTQKQLDDLGIPSMLLPVEHSFHSSKMLQVEEAFKQTIEGALMKKPAIPSFSASLAGEVEDYDHNHFWNVTRGVTRFSDLIESFNKDNRFRFIDLSPTGSLSTFIKYSRHDIEHYAAVNQFGRNIDSINRLITTLQPQQ